MGKEFNRHDRSFAEKVKAALDIVQIVEKTVPLHKESNEWYAGATSKSSQSGASLKVNSREQWYKNFATGDGGDVLNWIAYAEGLDIVQDFSRILQTAAGYANIPFEGQSAESQAYIEEVQAVHSALTQAAEIYHENLNAELREYIHKKWGINDETINALKIGYAKPTCNILGKIDTETLKKTGLLIKVGDSFKEFFTGRITFPYWNNGKVVNFAARGDKEFLGTPDSPYEQAKYKKLLVHNEKRPYISTCVNNRYLYGEDTVKKQKFCIITEGIADASVLIQNGYPVLSPVTTKFADEDIPVLVNAAKKCTTVYICNDNEVSEAGEKGAIKTAVLLKNEGVAVKIVVLPRENLDKMDIAEYFLRHTKVEFEEVKESSKDILVHLLSKVQLSVCSDATVAKTENVKKALEFVRNVLKSIKDEDEATLFIRNNIKNYFPKFTNEDIKALLKNYKNSVIEDNNNDPDQESRMTFDLDSESGRSSMTQILTREIMQQKNLKFVAGSLRVYDQGIYTATPEAVMKLQDEIVNLAATGHRTPIMKKHSKSVIEMLEIKTTISLSECKTSDNEIAVNNGILNLSTFELMPFTPEKVFFNKLPVDYVPDAPEPVQFLKFMNEILENNDTDTRVNQYKVMQEIFGYCLTNDYKYQKIFYLLGDGGNGKGTVLKILTYLLGNENISSSTLLQLTDHHNIEYYIAGLHGKKANICGDIGATKIENTENIKKLSSNTDLMSARLPYGMPFEFINTAKLIFAMNKAPRKDMFTTGDKRRDTIITFRNRISDTSKEIKGLSEIIRDSGEMPGILNWAIEGLKRLERNQNFSDNRSIAQRGLEYDMKSNPMKYFVDDMIETDPKGGNLPNIILYDAYTKYRLQHDLPEISEQELKNGIKYWCEQYSIPTKEKREYAEKILGFEISEDLKERLGKRPHVFTGIKLVDSTNEPQQKLNTPKSVENKNQTTLTTKAKFNESFKTCTN